MKKKNMKLLWIFGGLLAAGGIGWYFYSKSKAAPAGGATAGYLGAMQIPGRQFLTTERVDRRGYAAAGFGTGY